MNRVVAAAFLAMLCGAAHGESLLDVGYRQMYNLQFSEAHQTFAAYERDFPANPLGAVSDAAAYLFSEFERLQILRSEFAVEDQNFYSSTKAPPANSEMKQKFEAALAKTQQLARAGLQRSPPDRDAMFATTLSLGLHADYLALIERRNLAALSEIKQARTEADKLLAQDPNYYDAYIAGALENYLLGLKAAPIRWLLHATGAQTDRATGIKILRLTAEKGHYLAPYARLLLAVAAIRDHNGTEAKHDLQILTKEFPGNRLYRDELAKLN